MILAGITIATLFGENGIIKKAQKAKEEIETSSNRELDGLDEIEETMKNAINGIDKGDTEEGPQVNKGLVIPDGNSEFVFIPVANYIRFQKQHQQ